jgi:hypothetical protein
MAALLGPLEEQIAIGALFDGGDELYNAIVVHAYGRVWSAACSSSPLCGPPVKTVTASYPPFLPAPPTETAAWVEELLIEVTLLNLGDR